MLWYIFVLWVVFSWFPVDAPVEPTTSLVAAVSILAGGVIAVPLIENWVFTSVLKFFLHENPKKVAFAAALIAAALHASFRSLAAFGIFYVIAAVYLTHAKENPRYAFWLGVLIHAIFNFPGAAVPLLEVFGITHI